jgi:hypothetical protein
MFMVIHIFGASPQAKLNHNLTFHLRTSAGIGSMNWKRMAHTQLKAIQSAVVDSVPERN